MTLQIRARIRIFTAIVFTPGLEAGLESILYVATESANEISSAVAPGGCWLGSEARGLTRRIQGDTLPP